MVSTGVATPESFGFDNPETTPPSIPTNPATPPVQDLMEVKHPSELVALSTAHVQKRFETMIAQTKELTELAQKVATETAAPLKAGVTKAKDRSKLDLSDTRQGRTVQ